MSLILFPVNPFPSAASVSSQSLLNLFRKVGNDCVDGILLKKGITAAAKVKVKRSVFEMLLHPLPYSEVKVFQQFIQLLVIKLYPTATDKELVYYVEGNALEPINGAYLFSELVNSVFTADGDNVKVSVAVKFIDNQTKATQVSQYELTLCKDSNRKIIK